MIKTQGVTKLQVLDTNVIYRNPVPHVRSVHAYFPSVVVLPDGQMLATVVIGEAFEAANLRTHLLRSTDNGKTWADEGTLYAGTTDRLTSDCARITVLPDGDLAVFMIRHDRTQHSDHGLTNPATLGFVPTELMLLRSSDAGQTWTEPQAIEPALVGPSFEMCSPITVLNDGRWLIPTQTWQGWDGECPNGIKMIALVSEDQGKSWPTYQNIMSEPDGEVYFWESKVVELPDRRLLAVAWVYDDQAKQDRPNHYAISSDGGTTWTPPTSTGLNGQTLTPIVLDDGRILSIYRRMDQPGLWANLSSLEEERWVNHEQLPLWGQAASRLTDTSEDMTHNFNVLRFGAPSITKCGDGSIFVTFWCYEDCVSVIRSIRLVLH